MEQHGEFDVGIIGYGPVGATLANLLGRAGLSAAVFEREASHYHLPRAAHFDGEVMRVFQAAGLAEEVAATTFVNVGMRFVNADGKLLIDWPRPQEIGPQGWYPSYRFHQPALEAVLRRGLDRFPGHRVLFRNDVFALDEEATHVRVRHEDLSNGTLRETRCRYVVGCDGARSTVRRFMGSTLEDLGSHQRWLVVDVVLHEPVSTLKDYTTQVCDPARPTTVARGVGLRRRWEFMLMPGDDPATIATPAQVWRLLSPWLRPDQAEIERAVVYAFHSVLAQGWRRDRLILAGDAAHQTPPFLGQGLCAGIRDTANLAWKLAAVLRGEAPDTLLDTYESERAPHARAYIELAIRLGNLVQTTDPEQAAARDRSMAEQPELMASITPSLGPGLHRDFPAPAGTLSEQPRLSNESRMDDMVGMRFALLIAPALLQALPQAERDALDAAGVKVLEHEGRDYLAALGKQALLIRPDRYVLGSASTLQELQTVLGLLPLRHDALCPA